MEANGYLDYAVIGVDSNRRGVVNSSSRTLHTEPQAHLSVSRIVAEKIAVKKHGATTGCTEAVFSSFHQQLTIGGNTYNNVLEFSSSPSGNAIGDLGDSGSIVVSRTSGTEGAAVGLLFAVAGVNDVRGLVMPFDRLAALGFAIAEL